MKNALRLGLCLMIAGCLLSFAGCKKKAEPTTPAAPAATEVTKPAAEVKVEAPKATAVPAAEVKTEAAQIPALPAEASETIPVADVKDAASKMNVEQLKAMAMEYKNLIVEKKASIETIAAKLKAIPLTEQMGTEAKGLQTDMATLNKSVAALTERFQVYYGKLKEMGVDVSALGI